MLPAAGEACLAILQLSSSFGSMAPVNAVRKGKGKEFELLGS